MCTVSATLLFSGCSYLGKSTRIIAVIVFVIDPFFYTFLFPFFPFALLCFCRFREKLLANSRVLANLVSLFVQTNKHPSTSCVPRWCAAMHYYSFFIHSYTHSFVCAYIGSLRLPPYRHNSISPQTNTHTYRIHWKKPKTQTDLPADSTTTDAWIGLLLQVALLWQQAVPFVCPNETYPQKQLWKTGRSKV